MGFVKNLFSTLLSVFSRKAVKELQREPHMKDGVLKDTTEAASDSVVEVINIINKVD